MESISVSSSSKTTFLAGKKIVLYGNLKNFTLIQRGNKQGHLFRSKNDFIVRASNETGNSGPSDSTDSSSTSEPVKRTVVRRKKPATPPEPLEDAFSRAVEEAGISVEGVAKVDKDEDTTLTPILRIAALAAGDLAFLLLFAWIGRATHVSTAVDWELLKTADPFIAGWIAAAYFIGDYDPSKPPPKDVGEARFSAVKTWAVGVPLGIVIRSVLKGQLPAVPFVGVSLASTFVLLVGWRSALASVLYKKEEEKKKLGGNRRGNPFEFLELLTSLVRRW